MAGAAGRSRAAHVIQWCSWQGAIAQRKLALRARQLVRARAPKGAVQPPSASPGSNAVAWPTACRAACPPALGRHPPWSPWPSAGSSWPAQMPSQQHNLPQAPQTASQPRQPRAAPLPPPPLLAPPVPPSRTPASPRSLRGWTPTATARWTRLRRRATPAAPWTRNRRAGAWQQRRTARRRRSTVPMPAAPSAARSCTRTCGCCCRCGGGWGAGCRRTAAALPGRCTCACALRHALSTDLLLACCAAPAGPPRGGVGG